MNKRVYKILRQIVLALLTGCITVSFFGCAGSGGSTGQNLVLAWDFGVEEPVWRTLADEYEKRNPGVEITLDQKEGSTYDTWLSNQLTVGTPTADIVINNGVSSFYSKDKFVDFSQYLNKPNPYAEDAVWKTLMEKVAYPQSSGASNGQVYSLNPEQVITAWFYNKDLFEQYQVEEKVGKSVQDWNWDDLIVACEHLSANGIIPLAIGGDYPVSGRGNSDGCIVSIPISISGIWKNLSWRSPEIICMTKSCRLPGFLTKRINSTIRKKDIS